MASSQAGSSHKNEELMDYVKQLAEGEKLSLDDKKSVVSQFINKLNKAVDYRAILDRFTWKSAYFKELDEILITLGYQAKNNDIDFIKKFLKNKVKNIFIIDYNQLLNANIWNHFEIIMKNIDQDENRHYWWSDLSENRAAISILATNQNKINWSILSVNTAAIDLLELNTDKVNWSYLSANINAVDILKNNTDKIDWEILSMNKSPAAIELLIQNPDEIDWENLSANPAAYELIKQNLDKVDWYELSYNPAAINLLAANLDKVSWRALSENPAAIELLKAYPNKIDWRELSSNTNPEAIKMLANNLDKVDWGNLSTNESPAAVELFIQNIDKIGHNVLISRRGATEIKDRSEIMWKAVAKRANYINIIEANQDKIDWTWMLKNEYDYFAEKLRHFNAQNFFPQSGLKLT